MTFLGTCVLDDGQAVGLSMAEGGKETLLCFEKAPAYLPLKDLQQGENGENTWRVCTAINVS